MVPSSTPLANCSSIRSQMRRRALWTTSESSIGLAAVPKMIRTWACRYLRISAKNSFQAQASPARAFLRRSLKLCVSTFAMAYAPAFRLKERCAPLLVSGYSSRKYLIDNIPARKPGGG